MPLFRFHRGSLDESLKTTVIVKNLDHLKKVIYESWQPWINPEQVKNREDFRVRVYCPVSLEKSFDPRCGWYSHYVTCDIQEKDVYTMQGFLSEPMGEE